MEEYKKYKKDFSKLGMAFFIGTLIIYGLQLLVSGAVQMWKPEWLSDVNITLILSIMPMYLIGMPLLILMVKRLPGVSPERHAMKPGQFAVGFLMCMSIMYCSNLVGTVITTVIGLLKGSAVNNTIVEIASSANMGLTFFYMVLCAPILEEFIFRKLIVDRTLRYGQGAAIVMSGIMFGLFHGNLSQFAYAATMGMFLAFLYVKIGNIKITIGMHMLQNFIGGIVSVLVLKAIRYEELLQLTQGEYDPNAVTQLVMDNLGGWCIYLAYIMVMICLVIAGVVLLIVFRKRFRLEPGAVVLDKGKRFSTMFCNLGMILYTLFWICVIIAQLFWG